MALAFGSTAKTPSELRLDIINIGVQENTAAIAKIAGEQGKVGKAIQRGVAKGIQQLVKKICQIGVEGEQIDLPEFDAIPEGGKPVVKRPRKPKAGTEPAPDPSTAPAAVSDAPDEVPAPAPAPAPTAPAYALPEALPAA